MTYGRKSIRFAGVAELADAHGSGPCGSNTVWVQVPSPACNANGVDEMSTPFVLEAERALNPGFKFSAPLRSAQNRGPQDLVRPISCGEREGGREILKKADCTKSPRCKFSAPLRSAQDRGPQDLFRPISCEEIG